MRPLPPVAILAGGLATRLRPLTERIPKSLIPINGRPFIEYQLDLLRASGIRKAVICIGFLGDQIINCVGNGARFGIELQYSSEGERLLGTGGAIKRALPLLGDRFFVLYGDSYLRCDYGGIFEAFCHSSRKALMTVFRNHDQWDMSNVEYSGGYIRAYNKREHTPNMHHIDYGLGVFSEAAFDSIDCETPTDLAAIYGNLLQNDQLAGYEVTERFYEIGSRRGIEELSTYLGQQEKISGTAPVVANAVRAVFLDRDGVLNRAIVRDGRPYPPQTMKELAFLPDVRPALEDLERAGFRLIVVTNQPDVARGTQSREMVERMHERLRGELPVHDIFACWHDEDAGCDCRKPRPGMMTAARDKYGIDLSRSFLIGDRWRDIEAGHQAGCRTVFIDYNYNERRPAVVPTASVKSLREATDWILSHAAD